MEKDSFGKAAVAMDVMPRWEELGQQRDERMEDLRALLASMSLGQYYEALTEYGIESVEDLGSAEKEDLDACKVKPFHGRKLQMTLAGKKKTTGEVRKILDELRYEDYIEAFEKAGIDSAAELLKVSDAKWEELNVKKFHRKKILAKAEAME